MISGVVFRSCDELWAFEIEFVEKVVRAAAVRQIPGMSEGMLGFVGFRAKFIPVFDFGRLLNCDDKEFGSNDRFIILRLTDGHIALAVDEVVGVFELATVTDRNTEEVMAREGGLVKSIALPAGDMPEHDTSWSRGVRVLDAGWFLEQVVEAELPEQEGSKEDFGCVN